MTDMMTSIGISALNAAQAGLLTTGNNIANASTPGYSREQTIQAALPSLGTANGFIGQGVNVTTVQRIYSSFINTQLQQQQSTSSQLTTYYNQIQQINNIIADPAAGLSPALQNFFSAVNGVSNAPASIAARQGLISNAQSLTGTFQTLNQVMTGLATSTNQQISSSVVNINAYAKQIASLNQSILTSSASSTSQQPNSLLDQRNQLISQLSQEINATVLKQSNGSDTVYIGNGQPLVVGNQAMTLKAVPAQSNPAQLDIAYVTPNGTTLRLPSNSIQGGNLGGLMAFQNQSLVPTQSQLGLIATGLGMTINAQQLQGQDLNGALGTPLFHIASPVVIANQANTGAATVSATITQASALTGSNYTLSYNGSQYTLTRLSDQSITTSSTMPMNVDGLSLNVSATPSAGNSYLIEPTINGAQNLKVILTDPTKIAAAIPVQGNASSTNIGTGSLSAPAVTSGLPLNPNLQDTVTLTFTSPTTYNVTDSTTGTTLASGASYTPGGTISYNGWSTTLNGTPQTNDVFTVSANTGASTDGNNAVIMGALQSQNTLLGGTANFASAYAQLVNQVGTQTSQLQVQSTAQTNLVNQTTQNQQSISGVNLNEEAANLIQFQQAYQAAGKAIQVANTMFTTVLGMLN
ncbi:flagellar hook-associated protein FlgK [Ferrovum myxofaciens]|uniref:Flagellar hook-associated protein 1 n=1 Tax=Ferrovum myxofaciens TaxID=416213 RepID=A0A8F3DV08_9PROT|nr:flagellar hook-associated protein FlgK [Ferrovum myxofaciens]KXW58371.1 flagellar hook-associated protein 1 [Ferrovum myxofaciens]QKE38551.1 MAG: flagellar hook-associated protein FlgK [Ferrovum myxofaciens]QWY73743.1 MAG: flagellar hook-associated protein FlgK [Ferrovum myxofaciens]QWY76497.1 MAG: flagellar hook-associated protein FlgK [Ferrovum myxofaciens]